MGKIHFKNTPSYWSVDRLRKHIQFWSSFIDTVPLAIAMALDGDGMYLYWLFCYRNLESRLMTTAIFAIAEPVVSTRKSALINNKMMYFRSGICFYYNHSGNPNAYAVVVNRNQLKARSSAELFSDRSEAERTDRMKAAVVNMGRLHVSTRVWKPGLLAEVRRW